MSLTHHVHVRNLCLEADSLARDYLFKQLHNPDPQSIFAKTVAQPIGLSSAALVRMLLGLGYDGTISFKNSDLIGHAFFQDHDGKHGRERHVFSVGVVDRFRSKGYGEQLVATLLQSAHAANFASVRLGAGGDAWVTQCWQKAQRNELAGSPRFESDSSTETGRLVFVR